MRDLADEQEREECAYCGAAEHALKSARDALWAIANMQITENTDKSEVLGVCMSIARFELAKCSTAGK
jgi:hypothetical protein